MTKRRISASIDPDLLSAAEAAVKRRGAVGGECQAFDRVSWV